MSRLLSLLVFLWTGWTATAGPEDSVYHTNVVYISSRTATPSEWARVGFWFPADGFAYGKPNYNPFLVFWDADTIHWTNSGSRVETTFVKTNHQQWCGLHNMRWTLTTNWIPEQSIGLVRSNVIAEMVWNGSVVGNFVLESNVIATVKMP